MIFKLGDSQPSIPDSCFIAPCASVIGDVQMSDNASVWFNCVIRADNDTIRIGENSNIQDGSVLHVDDGQPIDISANVTIGHKVMLHGCSIGENTLIGINAVVLNGAKIGRNCLIGANALVTQNMEIPDGSVALGSPAKVVRQLTDKNIALLKKGAEHYVHNSARYIDELELISKP